MLQALRSVMLPARFEPGFVASRLYADPDEADSLCYLEEWTTQQDLEREIRSARFGRLLRVMESAAGSPTVEVCHLSDPQGWEYILKLRGDSDSTNGSQGEEHS